MLSLFDVHLTWYHVCFGVGVGRAPASPAFAGKSDDGFDGFLSVPKHSLVHSMTCPRERA